MALKAMKSKWCELMCGHFVFRPKRIHQIGTFSSMIRNSRAEADPGGAANSRCSSDRPDAEGGFTSEKEKRGQKIPKRSGL
jgi:hypothetical protein